MSGDDYLSSPAKLGQDIKVFLYFHKKNIAQFLKYRPRSEWMMGKNPLLNHFVLALELKSIRFQSLMNRFSDSWTFFLMPPT